MIRLLGKKNNKTFQLSTHCNKTEIDFITQEPSLLSRRLEVICRPVQRRLVVSFRSSFFSKTSASTRAMRAFENERGARERKEDFSGAGLSYPPFKQLRLVRRLGRRLYGSRAAGRWGSQKTSHFTHTLDTNQRKIK